MRGTSMKLQAGDGAQERANGRIQVRNSSSNGAPEDGFVANFPAKSRFPDGSPENDLRYRIDFEFIASL